MMKFMAKAKALTVFTAMIVVAGCSYIPESLDFSEPVTVTSLSESAWVVNIGKAMDRPSRFKISRVEAAKEAKNRECEFFKADALLNEQFSSFDGQQAYRCIDEVSEDVFITEEMLQLESV